MVLSEYSDRELIEYICQLQIEVSRLEANEMEYLTQRTYAQNNRLAITRRINELIAELFATHRLEKDYMLRLRDG